MKNHEMNPSNFEINVIGVGDEKLLMALRIAFDDTHTATHYSKTKKEFAFYWHEGKGSFPLPVAMGPKEAQGIVLQWLKTEADFGPEPDVDGTVEKTGWRVSDEKCRSVWEYAFIRIYPEWTIYGK